MGSKRAPNPPSSASSPEPVEHPAVDTTSASPESSKKRKRASLPADELEIDVGLPEPQSKKALRKSKKTKANPDTKGEDGEAGEAGSADAPAAEAQKTSKQSEYGVWVGNLPFTADKTMLRVFFTRQGQIPDADITRVHMPTPTTPAQAGRVKPKNKGFAYVDFATSESLQKAIALSEELLNGRKVLIKDAKSYEGRPANATATAAALSGADPAAATPADGKAGKTAPTATSKRIFVGNLSFDVTKEDLEEHFGQAGEVEDVHVATFQDTGKCKGFAWVRFTELEAAQAAVQGYIFKEEPAEEDDVESEAEKSDSSSDDESERKTSKSKKQKKQKKRKWFINRLHARPLRCEYAEDASTRYKKRFGKGARDTAGGEGASTDADSAAPITEVDDSAPKTRVRSKGDKDARQEQRRRKHVDARNIKPGAALASAPRASGAIVAGAGKKTTFD